jgi:hypothetical protein
MPSSRALNITMTIVYLAAVIVIALDLFIWRP